MGISSARPTPVPPHAAVLLSQKSKIPGTNRQMRMDLAESTHGAAMPGHESTEAAMTDVLSGQLRTSMLGPISITHRAGDRDRMVIHAPHAPMTGVAGAKVSTQPLVALRT